jgi:hypothetical protein
MVVALQMKLYNCQLFPVPVREMDRTDILGLSQPFHCLHGSYSMNHPHCTNSWRKRLPGTRSRSHSTGMVLLGASHLSKRDRAYLRHHHVCILTLPPSLSSLSLIPSTLDLAAIGYLFWTGA